MGRLFLIDLEGNFFTCMHCNTPFALTSEFIVEAGLGEHGMTYLFHNVLRETQPIIWHMLHQFILNVFMGNPSRLKIFKFGVNVTFGEEEEREMTGGLHTVVDIFCVKCGSNVGWKILSAQQQDEQYKVGKFILERRGGPSDPHPPLDLAHLRIIPFHS